MKARRLSIVAALLNILGCGKDATNVTEQIEPPHTHSFMGMIPTPEEKQSHLTHIKGPKLIVDNYTKTLRTLRAEGRCKPDGSLPDGMFIYDRVWGYEIKMPRDYSPDKLGADLSKLTGDIRWDYLYDVTNNRTFTGRPTSLEPGTTLWYFTRSRVYEFM